MILRCLWVVGLLLGPGAVAAQTLDRPAIDAAVHSFMQDTKAPGVAVGIVTPQGSQSLFYGKASQSTGRPVDAATLFELGSVSKTFTVTLAADAAETGALRWTDAPTRFLPGLKGSRLDDVTLIELATHTTGGMPLQLPDSVKTEADLFAWLKAWQPPAAPGSVRTYANPSIGLLGVVTAKALGGDLPSLMHARVFAPLGLDHTFYAVPPSEQANYAQGYTRDGMPIRLASAPLATEAYGIRTTANDLLRFTAAQLGLVHGGPVLDRAIADTHLGRFRAGPMTQAAIWEWYPLPVSAADFATGNGDRMVLDPTPVVRLDPPEAPPADVLINKTGATNGFGSYVAVLPARHIGLVILANRNAPTALRLALARRVLLSLGVADVGG